MTEAQFNERILFLEKMIAAHPESQHFLDAYMKLIEQNNAFCVEMKKIESEQLIKNTELRTQYDIATHNNNTDYDIARYRSDTEFHIAQNGYFTQRYHQDQISFREIFPVFANRGLFDDVPKLR